MAKVINTVLSLKDDFSGAIQKAAKNAENASGRIKQAFATGETGTEKLSNGLKQTGKEVTNLGKAVMPVSAAAAGALGTAVKASSDFQQAMANTWSIAKAGNNNSTAAFNKLSDAAKKAGEQGYYSATQAADALGYMALAGWDANKSAKALPDVLNLAAAAGMDLAQASDIVTDYMSAFGRSEMSTTQFTDMLSYAQNNSNTTVDGLSEAYKNCAANLNAAGQSAQTTTAILMGLANQGRKGSEAGTSLTAIMRDLTAKMKDGSVQIGKTSVKVQDAKGNYRNLIDILKDVNKATSGMGDAQKAAALSSVFTADSISGVNLIFQEGVDKIEGYSKALKNSGGSAADSAATKMQTLQGSLTIMKNRMQELGINMGASLVPVIEKVSDFLGKITEKFDRLSPGTQRLITIILMVVAVAGPLLIIIGQVITAMGVIIPALATVGGAIMAIDLPVVILVAAFATLAIMTVKHWSSIKAFIVSACDKIKAAWGVLKAVAGTVFYGIQVVVDIARAALALFTGDTQGFNRIVEGPLKKAKETFEKYFGKIKDAVNKAKEAMQGLIDKAKEAFSAVSSTTKQGSGKNLVGHNANGTPYWTGGLTRINEHGGELINLPNGSQIIPHDLSKSKVQSEGVTVHLTVQGNVIGNEQYADYLGSVISKKIVSAMANS